jgi:hypothetical protein
MRAIYGNDELASLKNKVLDLNWRVNDKTENFSRLSLPIQICQFQLPHYTIIEMITSLFQKGNFRSIIQSKLIYNDSQVHHKPRKRSSHDDVTPNIVPIYACAQRNPFDLWSYTQLLKS